MDGMLVHPKVTPSIKFTGTYLHTWVERDTVTAQEHNTKSPAKACTVQSGNKHTNKEPTVPPEDTISKAIRSKVWIHCLTRRTCAPSNLHGFRNLIAPCFDYGKNRI